MPTHESADHAIATALLRHNTWATHVLLDACRPLTHEQFHRRFEIGPGSLHNALRHVIAAMLRWADRIAARPVAPSIDQPANTFSVAELDELLTRADAALAAAIHDAIRDGRVGDPIEFPRPDGRTYRFSRAAAIAHVATHGAHHRAQAVNMRRQLGLPSLGLELDAVESELVETGQLPG